MSDFDIIHTAIYLIRTHCTYNHHWVADSLESRIAGWKKLEQQAEEKQKLRMILFNCGYERGHEDTVEGVFTPIHSADFETCHKEEVDEIVRENSDD
jgi:hypothetical protein